MVPAKKRPRRAFVGGGVMTDDESSESERKVSFEFNIKTQRRSTRRYKSSVITIPYL